MDDTVEIDVKLDLETEKPLCRCCLSTENKMLDATKVAHYFMELAGINVLQSDGLPLWICYECHMLLRKAVKFKYKMLRAQSMLYEYITRCAPFSIDATDPEIAQYVSPHLSVTHTLAFDTVKGKMGYHKVLQHEKRINKSELSAHAFEPFEPARVMPFECSRNMGQVELSRPMGQVASTQNKGQADSSRTMGQLDSTRNVGQVEPGRVESADPAVKHEPEPSMSDFEDDMPLNEFRSTENKLLNMIFEGEEQIKTESEGDKKRKKKKETKTKKRKKCESEPEVPPPKKSIRKPIEIDPEKIRVVILNPNEQVKQQKEENKASLKFPYQCNLCYKGFNFESKLQKHMEKHSPSRGPFECKLCTMYLPTAYSFSVHSLIHTRRYECLKCGRRMIDRASIYHHYRTQHEGITTVITCDLCGKVSSNMKTHRGHLRNHHSGERPKCEWCGKTLINKDSLAEHMQIHEGVRNYECSVCGKRCRTRAQIKHHQLKHTDVKDFYCVECDVRFKTAHSLRQHLKRNLKHADEQSFKFPCPLCPRRYFSASLLSEHVSVRHERRRVHACGACGAALATRGGLRRHTAAVHHARRRAPTHVCDTCGKAFRGKSVLTNHIRTHTGERPYACAACGRRFAQRHAARAHENRGCCKTKVAAASKAPPPPAEKEAPPPDWPRQELFYVTAGP